MKKLINILIIGYSLMATHCYTQWVEQTLPVSKPIVGIEFKDSLKGWAVTSSGLQFDVAYVLHTTNGGTNWNIQFTGTDYDFDAFDMVDENTGYIIGGSEITGSSRLFKTTDGGINWLISSPGVGIVFDDIFFPNKDSGFICGSNSFGPGLWFTSTGGVNWLVRTSGLAGPDVTSLFFLNNSTGWSGDGGGEVHFTTNAGQNWVQIGTFTPTVQSIFFINITTGWVGFTNGRIRYTSNGGTNWTLQTIPPVGLITDLHFFDSMRGYAGNRTSQILKTYNAGQNWGYQLDSASSRKFSFVDTLNGWSGEFGIARTTNGGGQIIYSGFVSNGNTVPTNFILHQNYPNPFNPITTIKLDVPKSSNINLVICDMLGRELYSIANEYLKAGSYSFTWDARKYSSGIYFYRLTADNFTETKKMMLIK